MNEFPSIPSVADYAPDASKGVMVVFCEKCGPDRVEIYSMTEVRKCGISTRLCMDHLRECEDSYLNHPLRREWEQLCHCLGAAISAGNEARVVDLDTRGNTYEDTFTAEFRAWLAQKATP